ncbi:MAG: ATP-binding cassette domain-containing protein, partial [Pseudomonadota bacterium]
MSVLEAAAPRLVATAGRRLDRTADPAMPMAVQGLTVAYDGKPVVFAADMQAPAASMTAIIGPNGAGKSTLLKGALGIVPVVAGDARFFGQTVRQARGAVAYMPQRASVDWGFPASARDVVTMGLYRRRGPFRPFTKRDRTRAMEALARVGMDGLADRQIGQL